MSTSSYKVGDMISLKSGLTRTAKTDNRCRIASILPNDHGHVQYRVQFPGESFERRITEDDIDIGESPRQASSEAAAKADDSEPWLKFSGIRIGK